MPELLRVLNFTMLVCCRYYMTDVIQIMSEEQLALMDPHLKYINNPDDPEKNMLRFGLDGMSMDESTWVTDILKAFGCLKDKISRGVSRLGFFCIFLNRHRLQPECT